MLNKLLSILKLIRVIRFELVVHVYKEQNERALSSLGSPERIEELEAKVVEYRRLKKAAVIANEQRALQIEAERYVERLVDSK